MLANLATVVSSTALGGYLVEAAHATSGSGRLCSLRNVAMQLSYLIAGPAGGVLGTLALGWSGLACGGVALFMVPFAWRLVREPPRTAMPSAGVWRDIRVELRVIIQARTIWAAAVIAALFFIAPGLSTALFYMQQNSLHMDTRAQGYLAFFGAGAGILAAGLYGWFAASRLSLRTLLVVCLLISAIVPLGYLFYDSYSHARYIEFLNGLGTTLGEVALMHLAVRATPVGTEALGFAVLMAVRNLFMWGSDWLGSVLIDSVHLTFNTLVYLNAGTTLLAVPLALMLPRAIVGARDLGRPSLPWQLLKSWCFRNRR